MDVKVLRHYINLETVRNEQPSIKVAGLLVCECWAHHHDDPQDVEPPAHIVPQGG